MEAEASTSSGIMDERRQEALKTYREVRGPNISERLDNSFKISPRKCETMKPTARASRTVGLDYAITI
jgi:hypothetical protein